VYVLLVDGVAEDALAFHTESVHDRMQILVVMDITLLQVALGQVAMAPPPGMVPYTCAHCPTLDGQVGHQQNNHNYADQQTLRKRTRGTAGGTSGTTPAPHHLIHKYL